MKFFQWKKAYFCFTLLQAVILPSARQASSQNANPSIAGTSPSLDSPVKVSDQSIHSQKSTRKKPKHHNRKRKKGISSNGQSTSGSQEEVTDQREVSQQSDQTMHKKK